METYLLRNASEELFVLSRLLLGNIRVACRDVILMKCITNLFSDSGTNLTKAVPVADLLKRLNIQAISFVP